MDFVVETSLYITHSRHDNQQIPVVAPVIALCVDRRDLQDGRYHKNLDLIDDIMTGPAQPDEDPSYYRKLAARDAFSVPSSKSWQTTG